MGSISQKYPAKVKQSVNIPRHCSASKDKKCIKINKKIGYVKTLLSVQINHVVKHTQKIVDLLKALYVNTEQPTMR